MGILFFFLYPFISNCYIQLLMQALHVFFFVGNDVKVVQKKIDSVQARFTELRDKVIDSTEQMEEALPLAQNFNDAHAEFLDWVLKTESQLRTKEATGQEAEEQVQVGESS